MRISVPIDLTLFKPNYIKIKYIKIKQKLFFLVLNPIILLIYFIMLFFIIVTYKKKNSGININSTTRYTKFRNLQ